MDRNAYLNRLSSNLARWVPEQERRDILRWYEEYFNDAGPERERDVINELGDPAALAWRLAVERGYVEGDNEPRRGPKLWQIITGAAIVVALSIPIMLFTQLATARSILGNAVTHAQTEVVARQTEPPLIGQTVFEENLPDSGVYAELEPFTVIDVGIPLGDVTVVADVNDPYSVGVFGDYYVAGRRYELTWSMENGRLRVWGNSEKQSSSADTDSHGVQVVITVPEGETLEQIQVTTGLGDVNLVNVVANEITVETGGGDVVSSWAYAWKKLCLTSRLGDVTLEGALAEKTEVTSGLGNVTVYAACAEDDCAYDLSTGLGDVWVNDRYCGKNVEKKGNLPYELEATSGLGDIYVGFDD